MALMSGGQLVLSDTYGVGRTDYYGTSGVNLTNLHASYAAIYGKQPWVYAVVRKRALATKRLPLKVYQRNAAGRDDARDTPYARLLRAPNPRHSGQFLWEWTSATFDLYGEAIWLKIRGRDGLPQELWPVHPTCIVVRRNKDDTLDYVYSFFAGGDPQYLIPERDVVHFRTFNPDSTLRGLSPLEPLRQTLLNEDAARRANESFWRGGARPGVVLETDKTLSDEAARRLKARWDSMHSGPDKVGSTAVLEDGVKANILNITAEDAQYIESRKLNREEVCAVYDMPPPAVHILDRATFSNITEQFRSVYRDTMAPHLGGFEAWLELQLRPEFDATGDLYAEFLMDEVLRGDFEQRTSAWVSSIQNGGATIAEWRNAENRPFITGTDKLLANAALAPIDTNDPAFEELDPGATTFTDADMLKVDALGQLIRAGFDAEDAAAKLGLPPMRHTGHLPVTIQPDTEVVMRSVMGHLGNVKSLHEVDVAALNLNGHTDAVQKALEAALAAGETVDEFRARVRQVLSGDANAT